MSNDNFVSVTRVWGELKPTANQRELALARHVRSAGDGWRELGLVEMASVCVYDNDFVSKGYPSMELQFANVLEYCSI